MVKDPQFSKAKHVVLENLDAIQRNLVRSVEEGMRDTGDDFYNELLGLLADTSIVKGWDELMEIVAKAKTLEIDIAAWMAMRGRTTVSLPWPKKG